jgi:hypothetical protein
MPQAKNLLRLLHNAVHGGGQPGGLEDGLVLVQLEPGLPVVHPGRLDTIVVSDGEEVGEVGRGEVLEDGVGWANTVGGGVSHRRKGGFLILEDKVAEGLGCELDYDGAGRGALLGGDGKAVGYGKEGRDAEVRGCVTVSFAGFKNGGKDLAVDNDGDVSGGGGGSNRESEDAQRGRTSSLVQPVGFLRQMLDHLIAARDLLPEVLVFVNQLEDGGLQRVDLGLEAVDFFNLRAEEVELRMQLSNVVHWDAAGWRCGG